MENLGKYGQALHDANDCESLKNVVKQILYDPEEYSFIKYAQLILKKNALGPEFHSVLNTVYLFAYGNFEAYRSNPNLFMGLDDNMVQKLKFLTLLGLFKQSPKLGRCFPLRKISKVINILDRSVLRSFLSRYLDKKIIVGSLTSRLVKVNKTFVREEILVIKYENISHDRQYERKNLRSNIYKSDEHMPYYCELCFGTVFQKKDSMIQHLTSQHSGQNYTSRFSECIHCSKLMTHYYSSDNGRPLAVALCKNIRPSE